MKVCGACSQKLPKDKFSKKQWQAKQQRRCKDCIAANRQVQLEEVAPANDDDAPATDEDLFKESPPREECPICLLTMPLNEGDIAYFTCCGKQICGGCVHAHRTADNRRLCAFCRSPMDISHEEIIERLEKRAEGDDEVAIDQLGSHYYQGTHGLRQNLKKAMKLWLRAGKLGCAAGYYNLGNAYNQGRGVERDVKKSKYYWELATMGGCVQGRHNLGAIEYEAGNIDRATKHWMISGGAGYNNSLKAIRECFLNGHVTKVDFEKALRTHKEAADEMKSDQRAADIEARRLQ